MAFPDVRRPVLPLKNCIKICTCSVCTLVNPLTLRLCDACGSKHDPEIVLLKEIHQSKNKLNGIPVVDLDSSDEQSVKRAIQRNRGAAIRSKSPRKVCGTLDNKINRIETKQIKHKLHEYMQPKSSGSSGFGISWTCKVCTLQNPNLILICDACGEKNREVLPPNNNNNNNGTKKLVLDRRKSNDPRAPVKKAVFERFGEILEICESTEEKFVDDSFPPAPKSLYINKINCSTSKRSYDEQSGQASVAKWLRPEDIRDSRNTRSKWKVISKPVPSDICQGKLGNCWFIASLALIAEKEELLNNILKTKEISPAGAYIIRLNKDGRWTDVIVDDLFPCDSQNRLVYSRGNRKQLWVPLIEKAMAKLHGSYEALVAGHVAEGLMTLTGFPCKTLRLNDDDLELTWATLLSNRAADFLMGAASGSQYLSDEEFMENGLVRNHVYSILNVVDEWNCRLVQLRNPWGRQSWTGDWSDGSKLWTFQMRSQLKPTKGDEGIFWISFQDLTKYFSVIDVCRVRKNWEHSSFQGIFLPYADSDHHPVYSIKVSKPTEIDVTILQNSGRDAKGVVKDWRPGDLTMLLFRSTDGVSSTDFIRNSTIVENTLRKRNRMVNINCMLDPGLYYLIPFSLGHWTDHASDETFPGFEISIHSSRPIECSRLEVLQNPYLLADVIIKMAIECCERLPMKGGNGNVYCSNSKHNTIGDGQFYMLENSHPTKWLAISADLSESSGVVSTRGAFKTLDCIPPRSRQVINVLTPIEHVRCVYSCKRKFALVPTSGLSIFGEYEGINHVPYMNPRTLGIHTPRPI